MNHTFVQQKYITKINNTSLFQKSESTTVYRQTTVKQIFKTNLQTQQNFVVNTSKIAALERQIAALNARLQTAGL